MPYRTDDLRIREIKELVPPAHVLREFQVTGGFVNHGYKIMS